VAGGLALEAAIEAVASNTVFTTHMPVPAGHDQFTDATVVPYVKSLFGELGAPDKVAALARPPSGGDFNMTALAIRGSRHHNGVSRIHGGVSQDLLKDFWPQVSPEENPVGYITNAVHVPTFLAPEWGEVLDRLPKVSGQAGSVSLGGAGYAPGVGMGDQALTQVLGVGATTCSYSDWIGTDVLSATKRFDEALSELRRAEELDPLSPIIATNTGDTLQQMRRYDEAIAQYKRTLTLDANFGYAHSALGMTYGSKGMYAEAIAEMRRFIELSADPSGKGYLSLWLGKAGHRDEAMKLLTELKQESSQRYVPSYAFAMCYMGLGQKEEALNALEKEISDRSPNAIFFGVNPELDELRGEPRFKDMLRRLNLPE